MPFNRYLVKQIEAHAYHGIPLSNKKVKLLIRATTWMNLQGIMLSQKSQTQKVTRCTIHLCNIYESKHLQMENRSVIARS